MSIIMKEKGCMTSTIGYYLVIAGAVNWGLVGVGLFLNMNLNVVSLLFGSMNALEAFVYILIGLSGVMTFVGCKCATCKAGRVDVGVDVPKA